MSETLIMFLINLGLSMPDLAMKIQKLFMVKEPTQADWDAIWDTMAKTPAQYRQEALDRLNPPVPPA
jgi:hypothetical protein